LKDKKQVIFDAAKALISRYGLKKTTTDDIARKAKVSKATVYRYYKNKEDIFREICVLEVDDLWLAVEKAVNKQTDIEAKLKAHLITKIQRVHKLIEFYGVTPELWNEYREYIDLVQDRIAFREMEMLAKVLNQGNKSGELEVAEAKLVAHMMITSLKSLENPWILDKLRVPLPEYLDLMIGILMNGLAMRKKNVG